MNRHVAEACGIDASRFMSLAAPRAATLAVAYSLLALLLAVPMLLVEVPMGVDTLAHLARIHVQAHIADDPDLARLFEVRADLIPYMGLDWLMTPLARVLPTLVAGRVFIVLLLWGLVGATAALQRGVLGRVGFGPLLVGLVGYNALLAWGFLNYLLGVVGALLGVAAWHALRGRPWGVRLLAGAAVSTGLFFVHLLGLVLYGLAVAAYEAFGLTRPWRAPVRDLARDLGRDGAVLVLQAAPAGFLFLVSAVPTPYQVDGPAWAWGSKLAVALSPFLFGTALGGKDAGPAAAAVCLILLAWLTLSGALRWNRLLAAPAAALAVLALVAPFKVQGITFIDLRFPVAAACLAFAALSAAPSRSRHFTFAAFALAAALLAQAASAAATMRACDKQYGELRAALALVPRGAVLTPVLEDGPPAPGVACANKDLYRHMPQMVTIERSGYSPDFFARTMPVGVREGLTADAQPADAATFTPGMLPPGGHVLWMHMGRPVPALPGVAVLYHGSFFDLLAAP